MVTQDFDIINTIVDAKEDDLTFMSQPTFTNLLLLTTTLVSLPPQIKKHGTKSKRNQKYWKR